MDQINRALKGINNSIINGVTEGISIVSVGNIQKITITNGAFTLEPASLVYKNDDLTDCDTYIIRRIIKLDDVRRLEYKTVREIEIFFKPIVDEMLVCVHRSRGYDRYNPLIIGDYLSLRIPGGEDEYILHRDDGDFEIRGFSKCKLLERAYTLYV